MRQPPVFVNCRDRVEDLRLLVAWLERSGYERITLLDNDSTWEPLLDFYQDCAVAGHEVVYLPENFGSKALWKAGLWPKDEPYVLTDPDIVPIDECPADCVDLMWEVLEAYDRWPKIGLGLFLDDCPEFQSLGWERKLVTPGSGYCAFAREVEGTGVTAYGSAVDTTFALYRAGHRMPYDLRGIRLGFPYQARHMSWYRLDSPTEEERYYLARAIKGPAGSSWADGRQ